MTSSHVGINRELVSPGTPWIKGRVYQWDSIGMRWYMLPPPDETNRQNAAFYLLATSDMTEGAPEAVFSFAQIRSLVASSIFADLIGAKNIVINTDGSIESDGFFSYTDATPQRPAKGFRIRANGEAEFNDAVFRGSLSGRLMNGKHLHIHTSHIISASNSALSTLYNMLRNLNIRPNFEFY